MAFFTEIPQIESVHSLTVAKVLTISRASYGAVSASFPIGSRTVLENLSELADTVRFTFSPHSEGSRLSPNLLNGRVIHAGCWYPS